MFDNNKKTKVGLLLFATERMLGIGKGTPRGAYEERVECHAQVIVDKLRVASDVVYDAIVYRREQVPRVISTFYREQVDYVLAIHLGWTEDFNWVRFLRDMPNVPILLASRTRDELGFSRSDTGEDDFTESMTCTNMVGALEASGNIERIGRAMVDVCCGTLDEIIERAGVFGRAARCRSKLLSSTIGLVGTYNEVMWSTYIDPYDVFAKIGPELHFYTTPNILDELQSIPDQEVSAQCARIYQSYELGANIDSKKLEASVRASMAFDRLAQRFGLDCVVINDIDPKLIGTLGLRAGFVQCSAGPAVMVPEGDIGSGIAALILKILGNDSINYAEMLFIDRKGDYIAVGHAGPCDYTVQPENCKIGNDERFARASIRYPGAPIAWYRFPAGERTMLHFSQGREQYKLVSAKVEALPCEHFLATFNHGVIRPVGMKCDAFIEALMKINVTQHYCLTPGDLTKEIAILGSMLGVNYISVNS